MPPLPLVSPIYNVILVIAFIGAFGPDAFAIVRESLSPRGEKRDRGSFFVAFGAMAIGWLLASLCAVTLPQATFPGNRSAIFWAGITLMALGTVFRFYAIRTLGRYFTREVAIHAGQKVIESGPYRYIRHPSYSGLLLALLGLTLTLTNWASLLVMTLCVAPGIGYRIFVEERALRVALGQPYIAYMARTRRLIPFVL